MKNQVGGLARALQAFQDLGINVLHIESRPSDRRSSRADILVDVECEAHRMEELTRLLRREVQSMKLETEQSVDSQEFAPPTPLSAAASFGNKTKL